MKKLIALALLLLPLTAGAATEKTWQYVMNQVNPGSSAATWTHYQLWFIKEILTGDSGLSWSNQAGSTITPTGGWTLVGTSGQTGGVGGTTFSSSMAGVDYLGGSTFNDSTWVRAAAASNHSWMAFQHSTYTNYKLIIDYSSTSGDNYVNIVFGYGTLTGGNTATAPSLSVGATVTSTFANQQMNDASALGTHHVHGMLSTEGDFWMFESRTGVNAMQWVLSTVSMTNRPSWQTNYPFVNYTNYASSGGMMFAHTGVSPFNSATVSTWFYPGMAAITTRFGRMAFRGTNGGLTSILPLITPTGTAGVTNVNGLNNFLGHRYYTGVESALMEPDPNGAAVKWEIHAAAYDSTSATTTYAGRLQDVFIASTARGQGDVTPASGNIEYMIVGNLWVPTNTTPIF